MEPFKIESEHYAGPLETLLDLIEKRKLSVSKVSLAEVCDGYLAYIEKLPELPLSETSQFVLVASTLLLIKSRSLLPTVELSDDEEQSIEELERRLQRYALIRKASKTVKKQWGAASFVFARRTPDIARIVGMEKPKFAPGEVAVTTLRTAVYKLMSTFPSVAKLGEASVAPVLALEEVIANLNTRLSSAFRAKWSEFTKGASRHDTIVHFLAVLELVRSGSISATQDKLFSDIVLESEAVSSAPRYG